ncbi:enoyl-CoA hydratase-related protein [Paenarthrobacter sp. NPDC058040]|uniref:enoyl-CoA hydratase-related protein n=1 Tax=unclassified Paenarthrobacter TaxID=2634190 RepID=UPI0036DE4CE6
MTEQLSRVVNGEPARQPYQHVLVQRQGRVGIIKLNRPEALNSLTSEMCVEVVDAASRLDADPGIGALVLAGCEKAFAAGADIREMQALDYSQVVTDNFLAGWDSFANVRTPTVAAVSGYALGGGCELALMCDVIIAAATARFGLPEVSLGTIPGLGGTQRLTRAIGMAKAMDLILTGRTMLADEAERLGLVSRVVPNEQVMQEALEVAETIAAKSLPALYAAKAATAYSQESGLSEGLQYERRTFHGTFALRDRAEGMAAFLEKRTPRVTHS